MTEPDRLDNRPRLPGGGYSEDEIARGLQALALFAANSRRAAEHLKACGHPIPRSTLKGWLKTRAEDYERARIYVRDRVWDQMAEEHQAVARDALRATHKAMDRAEDRLAADDVRGANSAASAARNLATVAGITNDKAALAHGRPTSLTEHRRSPDELFAALRRIDPGLVVDDDEPIEATEVRELPDSP